MVDRNDRSTAADPDPNKAAILPLTPRGAPVPEPIWRYRPPLKPAGVTQSLRNRMLPKIGLSQPSMSSNVSASADHGAPFEVQQFTFLVLGSDETAAFAYVESLIAQGAPTDLIFLNLLAQSARRLGEMWEADTTDFANVTLGVSRLQRILRHLGERSADSDRGTGGGAVLLTTIPGEQHSFGLAMVTEFFRRDGWEICTGPFPSRRELFALVQERWFDIIGFSITSDRRLDEVKRDIHNVRRDSRNRKVGIMVGGPMLMQYPDLANSLGADASVTDGSVGPQLARELIMAMKAGLDARAHSQLRSALL